MNMTRSIPRISGAVEGLVDEAVLTRLIRHVGAVPGSIHGKHGKQYLQKNLYGYVQAAAVVPWVVLVDLDQEFDCPPPLVWVWLPEAPPGMCFRVAVREVEAWLLADRERLAQFLGIEPRWIPRDVEGILHPKEAVVALARRSRRHAIRRDMTPPPGSGRTVGPAYTSRLIEFALHSRRGWRPQVAAAACESLRRCLGCLRRLQSGAAPAAETSRDAPAPDGSRRAGESMARANADSPQRLKPAKSRPPTPS